MARRFKPNPRQGRRGIYRKQDALSGRAFTEPQLEVFAAQGTSQVWMETIARLEDADDRGMAVDLIAQGWEPAAAVAAATEVSHIELANGKTVDLSAVAATDALFESELTDDQWLAVHCSTILACLTDPARFRADAIFYRRNIDALSACHTKIGRNAIRQTELISLGHQSFHARIMRQFRTAHPKHWRRCDACEGTGLMKSGMVRTKTPCQACSGGGYLVTQEDLKARGKKATPSAN
ncbi:hypothetical protein TA3x_005065 [Tundrisphaera sp. TA3]|uniref:hypothetical protein n=1 Tax=Tundrisphaera sp. TA3 TaxID=3435775 RepID=UPI003EBB310C